MTIALTMIVKDEEAVLSRALDGICDAVDEIVVVDTGSKDRTKEIARRYTDKIFDFAWADDFSAARNYALSKSSCDYWMWLDADDIVPPATAKKICALKKSDADTDVYMLPYVLSRDERKKATFSFFRERIMKRSPDLVWRGRVHEAVELRGKIEYLSAEIEHAKPAKRDSGTRNLDIYRKMIALDEPLSPRERYYYARELFHNGFTADAATEFERFIGEGGGYHINKADACLLLSRCFVKLSRSDDALAAAALSLSFGAPSPETCCELGARYFERNDYPAAAFWYKQALGAKPLDKSGAFSVRDCREFIPLMWLTVCFDRMGDREKAFRYHLRAKKSKPNDKNVAANSRYFSSLGFSDNTAPYGANPT